jgi:membrane protease YdiL (CAAX protease family)
MLLGFGMQPFYLQVVAGVSKANYDTYIKDTLYKTPNVLFGIQLIFQICSFLLPALVFSSIISDKTTTYLGLIKPKKSIHIGLVIVIGLCLIFCVSSLATLVKQLNLGDTSRELDEQRAQFIKAYLQNGNIAVILKSVFLMALVPALCEELFFRGVIMKFMYAFTKKWWLAIGLSSVIFTLFHASISEFLPIFIAGVLLGYVYYLTSSITLSILLHFLFNGLQVVLSSIAVSTTTEERLNTNIVLLSSLAISSIIILGLFHLLKKNRTPLPEHWNETEPNNSQILY